MRRTVTLDDDVVARLEQLNTEQDLNETVNSTLRRVFSQRLDAAPRQSSPTVPVDRGQCKVASLECIGQISHELDILDMIGDDPDRR